MSEPTVLQLTPAMASAVAALASAATAGITYLLNRQVNPLAVSAKLMDRLYELNRLVLQYPEEFAVFIGHANRATPYFYAAPSEIPRDRAYYRVRAFTYFHLDFFEEIFLASKSRAIRRSFDSENWFEYIDQRMRHRLLQEIFKREAGRSYKGEFSAYVNSKWPEYQQRSDPDAW